MCGYGMVKVVGKNACKILSITTKTILKKQLTNKNKKHMQGQMMPLTKINKNHLLC